MNSRIRALRKKMGLNQSDFSSRIGLTSTSISKIEKGVNKLTEQNIKSICREFNVNEEWLRTGSGNIFNEQTTFSLDEFLKKQEATKLEIEIVKLLFSFDKNTRSELIEKLKNIFLSENSNDELSATKEMSLKPAYKMTDEEIDEEVEAYRQQLILEKTQEEKSSVFQKNELA